ncbi:MAG: tetratricopeptide repeat protein [Chthoniobacteraceae bacterium]
MLIATATGEEFAAAKTHRKPTPTPAPATKPTAGERPPATDDLYEGPASAAAAKSAAPKPGAGNYLSAPLSPGPKYADAWPSEARKSEADLQLTHEAENRALAVAAFAEGQMADEKGDPDKAIEAWKRATGLDPANASLAVKVATELAKRNEPAEAIRVLKDSIAAAPKEPGTYIYLAQVYAKHLNKPELAMQMAQKAMAVAPDYFGAWASVYELLEQGGEKQKAAELIEKGIKSTSKDPGFWLGFGSYLRKVFLKDDGTATPEELRQMETVFAKAVELKPDDASVLAQAGDFAVLARKNKEALDFYERAVKLNQPVRDEATKNLREKYIRALAANSRGAEAIPLLEQFARDPNQSLRQDLFELLGELYEQSGQMDKAIDHYKRSLVLDAGEPRNHFNLANMQLRAKKPADAVETMEKARRKFPARPDVTLGLALALSAAKRHADAMRMFANVVREAKGTNDELLDGEFYFKWGAAAEQAGQFEKAAEYLRKSISLNPEAPEAYNYLGYMWVDRGQNVEEAGQLIRRAVEIRPDNGAYLDSLGWYYFKVGKFEEAKKELLSAVNQLPEEDAVVFDHLADTCEQLGSHADAIKYWERALKLKPEDAEKISQKLDAAKQKQGTAK